MQHLNDARSFLFIRINQGYRDRPLLELLDDTTKLVSRLSGLLDYRTSIPEMSLIETLGINVVLLSFLIYIDFNYFNFSFKSRIV